MAIGACVIAVGGLLLVCHDIQAANAYSTRAGYEEMIERAFCGNITVCLKSLCILEASAGTCRMIGAAVGEDLSTFACSESKHRLEDLRQRVEASRVGALNVTTILVSFFAGDAVMDFNLIAFSPDLFAGTFRIALQHAGEVRPGQVHAHLSSGAPQSSNPSAETSSFYTALPEHHLSSKSRLVVDGREYIEVESVQSAITYASWMNFAQQWSVNLSKEEAEAARQSQVFIDAQPPGRKAAAKKYMMRKYLRTKYSKIYQCLDDSVWWNELATQEFVLHVELKRDTMQAKELAQLQNQTHIDALLRAWRHLRLISWHAPAAKAAQEDGSSSNLDVALVIVMEFLGWIQPIGPQSKKRHCPGPDFKAETYRCLLHPGAHRL
eukprot:TRINITY_DN11623_c0_g2_i1.p1 TRINITY_DN11623_c0_g2~~TRINITY_DN11623_c0_g2_i1.p1  ORF type:complete len:445 (+),score=41.13 TRINITY_DN11623_c0_g2_i1:198-1337(+)